jgi:hypothetical protein
MAKPLRTAKSFRRAEPIRDPYPLVLIVCEGAKSEPNYFNRLRHVYRLSSTRVVVTPANGTDPVSIVSFAKDQFRSKGFNRVYCVFDRNGHSNYEKALQRISQSNNIFAITSVPCFEVWVLLHFIYCAAPFTQVGTDSACALVIKEVQKHFPQYAKGYEYVFDDLEENIEQAINRATQLSADNARVGSTNPDTKVHTLINYLRNLMT